jgi:RHS repeat-associated protein
LLSDGTNDYIYGPDDYPVEQIAVASGTTSYLLADEVGSIRVITNSSGNTTETFTYDAWGNKTGSTGSATSPFGFAGQYLDSASGSYYMRARWYDPATGQFSTVDPQVASTLAPYEYAANEPLGKSDPSGALTCTTQASCNMYISENYENLQVLSTTGLQYLQSFGFSLAVAAGIEGNLIVENSLIATADEPGVCGGIACWTGPRFSPVTTEGSLMWFAQTYYETSWTSIDAQYHFIDWELYTYPRYGLSTLENDKTAAQAASDFDTYEDGADIQARQFAANSVYTYG